uniref:Rhodanese domain-containing protein n=1 Tax=Chlamydomonas leiostraca TaxID=1034604 RepID=A0A7S0RJ93_9CHLO|mmetsp:Transcript_23421/g.59965  ORF Transcript_23421/g.59965 Transcript_23421/m.59965 type:complete len:205 (+) Transcript_23421:89-703(+)|eukprot:CAMPEP_0202867608 /NCGR_PEP_ID=MMETSP1391-20130828/9523_1 /ASSEMBLY_ACC=CAM_ASM_000867 /TAXON_ID=1034604 /ORGANISM="Chlamydomonas leiostraca, Strain SAG 11-49" /LENGTH=204 /DNA_ID=CAMNT_0049547661 /DNA_START=81 /DNA_END=695 /DNA_ORIENTATION=+
MHANRGSNNNTAGLLVRYIDPEELAVLLRQEAARADTILFDVRSKDFESGRIRNAVNVPARKFHDEVALDGVIDQHLQDAQRVVVYCQFSHDQGPGEECAQLLAHRLKLHGKLGEPSVLLLRGGWRTFAGLYSQQGELVSNVAGTTWSSNWGMFAWRQRKAAAKAQAAKEVWDDVMTFACIMAIMLAWAGIAAWALNSGRYDEK